jgi:phage major head subunit gpT-like protein
MLINSATIAALNQGVELRFQQALTAATPMYPMLVTEIPSTHKAEVHAFLDQIPGMKEWKDERVIENLVARDFTIVNRHFEDTIGIDRDAVEDDAIGLFLPKIDMLAQSAAMLPDDLTVDAIQGGHVSECYDGQYFFDTDHPVDIDDASKGTQSNSLSLALSAANYATARAAMASLLGRSGKPLQARATHLVVPPQLEEAGRTILNADTISTGGTNVWKGSAELVVWDRLGDDPTAWYLLDCSKPIRPFVFQNRKPAEFTSLTDPNSETVFKKRQFLYGVDARGEVGYALWFLALKSKP